MPDQKIPEDQGPQLEQSTTTRSEALRESLKARRTPVPPREFSTLVVRSEGPQTAPDDQLVTEHSHDDGCTCALGRRPSAEEQAAYDALLAEVQRRS